MQAPSRSPLVRTLANVAYDLGLLFLTVVFLWSFLIRNGINSRGVAYFMDMVEGRAARPYVCRCLVPGAVRVVAGALPKAKLEAFGRAMDRNWLVDRYLGMLHWEPQHLAWYLIATALMFGSLLGFLFAVRYLFERFYPCRPAASRGITLAALLGLFSLYKYTNYIYDPATLFLFTLGLGLMARRRWGLFLAVYFFACLNKETTILLTLIFVLVNRSAPGMNARTYRKVLVAQLVIFAAVKGALTLAFRNNPGSVVEFHFDQTFAILTRGFSLETLMAWVGLGLLVFHRWDEKPLFLRRGLIIAIPLVLLTSILGFVDELRDYYEVYPIVLLLAAHSVMALTARQTEVQARNSITREQAQK